MVVIDRGFWKKVAEKWSTRTDGVDIPELPPVPDEWGDEEEVLFDDLADILGDIEI